MNGIVVWGGILESPNHQFTIRQIRPPPRAHEFWDFAPQAGGREITLQGDLGWLKYDNFGQIKEL